MRTFAYPDLPEQSWAARRVIAVDVDGTLIHWPHPDPGGPKAGKPPEPNRALIERLRRWKAEAPHRVLIVWSGMGEVHAANAVRFCGIGDLVDAILPKPTLLLDDAPDWFEDNALMVDVRPIWPAVTAK